MAPKPHHQNRGACDEKDIINIDDNETTSPRNPPQRSPQTSFQAGMRQGTIPLTDLVVNSSAPVAQQCSLSQPILIDLSDDDDGSNGTFDDDDYMTDEDVAEWMRQQHRVETHLSTRRTSEQFSYRNPTISNSFRTLRTITITVTDGVNANINANTNVELKDGDFMRVKHIVQNTATKEIKLRGWLFRRAKVMKGLLDCKMNELCLILHVAEDDPRSHQIQGMEEVTVNDVLRRRAIRLTNRLFPELSWSEENHDEDNDTVYNKRVLVCRYKLLCTYSTAKARVGGIWSERSLERLSEDECDRLSGPNDRSCSYDEKKLRYDWRGESLQGGACKKVLNGEKRFLLREQKDAEASPLQSSSAQLVHRGQSLKRGEVGNLLNSEALRASTSSLRTPIDAIEIDPFLPDRQPMECQQRLRYSTRQVSTPAPIIDLLHEDSQEVEVELVSMAGKLNLSLPSFCQKSAKKVGYAAEKSSRISTLNKRPRHESDEVVILPKISKPFRNAGNHDARRNISPSFPEETAENENRSYHDPQQIGTTAFPRRPIPYRRDLFQRRYTFGDSFCGAGGTSRGAVMAGLRVEWGFDFDLAACRTYAKNYYQSTVYHVSANEFINLEHINHKVDILHVSPPCQFFSGAHTVPGKDDDMNRASLFAVVDLVAKARPRVVTLEQTAGLERRHPLYFNKLVNMFTSQGFSVRWKIMDLRHYGLPQKRKRLIMIASCPGERLPPFPPPTYSQSPIQTGLKPFVTINDAISQIPDRWDHHDPWRYKPRDKPPYDGDTQSRTMTTSGGGLYHPSGTRSFTSREFACLQGFGLEHKFFDKAVRKQIGNAVPPCVAEILLEGVKTALKNADGLSEEEV